MNALTQLKKQIVITLIGVLLFSVESFGQRQKQIPPDGNLYVNPERGNNDNSGSSESPVQSLYEAAQRVNNGNGKGAITIYLSEGIHGLDATVTFHPVNWHFTKDARLTIRASSLPDDADWHPAKMPVIISTMPLNFKPGGDDDRATSYGIQIEISHVTIQGLRVLGTPVHERPNTAEVWRNYPIVREGLDLDDLRITQCLFLGDKHAMPNHLPILASGHGVVVDHCVFYRVKDAVVFFMSDRPAERCEMHHNLIVGNYGGAVWSWSAAPDFKYYNNVVANTNIFWVLNKAEKNAYKLSNSMVIGYKELIHRGGGAKDFGVKADEKKLIRGENMLFRKDGSVEIEEDLTMRNYLHLKPGTLGANLGAGLFTK